MGKYFSSSALKWIKRLIIIMIALVLIIITYPIFDEYKKERFKEKEAKRVEALVLSAQADEDENLPLRLTGNTVPDPVTGKPLVSSVVIKSADGLCKIILETDLYGDKIIIFLCDKIIFFEDVISIKVSSFKTIINKNFYTLPSLSLVNPVSPGDDPKESISSEPKEKNIERIVKTEESNFAEKLYGFSSNDYFVLTSKTGYITQKLRCSKMFAVEIPAAYPFWTRFDLTGTSTPIGQLGKLIDHQPQPCGNGKSSESNISWNHSD